MKKLSVVVLLILGLFAAAFWLFLQSGQPASQAPAASTGNGSSPGGKGSLPSPTAPPQRTTPAEVAPVASAPVPVPDGGEKISAIISNQNLDFPSAVVSLLEILPGLTESEQAEAAQHAANLSDEKSAAQWSAMLVAGQLPPAAGEVLFNDLLNRPHDLTMPALAAMADQPYHAKSKDSIAILDVLYGQPPQGKQWAAWVKEKMAETPR